MPSGADLFVVCKQCGSEVSPYITECPYCGHRLRRRAPKLPRAQALGGTTRTGTRRWPRARMFRTRRAARPRRARLGAQDRWVTSRPYATAVLVAASCATWVLWQGRFVSLGKMVIVGPLHGDWWKLVTSQFAYGNGLYEFVTLLAIAIFGWLLGRRHGPLVVVGLFLGAGATGALVACAVYSEPAVSGGSAGALALLAAWAVPDLQAARAASDYDGDLLGVGAIAALLLAVPFALPHLTWLNAATGRLLTLSQTSWLAGVAGGAFGLAVGLGLGLAQGDRAER
jgi:membrane associated rhomboid family serine protease